MIRTPTIYLRIHDRAMHHRSPVVALEPLRMALVARTYRTSAAAHRIRQAPFADPSSCSMISYANISRP
jgi:hypothetical protein